MKIQFYKVTEGVIGVLLIIMLSSCAGIQSQKSTKDMQQTQPDPVTLAIWSSAQKIREALSILREKEGIGGVQPVPEPMDPSLRTTVTMRAWNGPAKNALDYIGFLTGYSVREMGDSPPLPPLVSIHVFNEPAHYILQNVAQQISGVADVVVSERKKEIILRYTGGK